MINDYIDFYYDDEDNFVARICKNGKYKNVRNPRNVDKLISIAEKYNYNINHEGKLTKRATAIIAEYDRYMARKKRRIKIYNQISSNMKISRKDPTINKRLAAGALALVILGTGIGLHRKHTDSTSPEQTTISSQIESPNEMTIYEELTGTIDDTEDYSISNEEETNSTELSTMLQSDSFHFSYEDQTSSNNLETIKQYEDIFSKYATYYGLDKNLLMAIAAQESSGNHYGNLESGPAIGIMQIEKSVHIGENIAAYNFVTGDIDNILITEESLKDLETNIQIGAILFKDCLKQYDYNIPLAVQGYNYGFGNMYQVLKDCTKNENLSFDEIRKNANNNAWLKYRDSLNIGDPQYLEHVFSYLGNTELTVLTRDGEQVSVTITNDYQKNIQYN